MTLPPGEGVLQLPGQRLEYRLIDGAAPVVVLLHEGLGSVSAWGRFPDQLAAATGSAVFVYSRAGYGRSSDVSLPRPLDYMQREALDVLPLVLDSLGAGRVILAGHSDGASIAAIYAGSIIDNRIRGVILMAPHFFVEAMTIAAIARTGEAYATTDLRERLARHHGAVDVAFRGWYDAWLDPGFRAFDIRDVLASIRVPVLVVQGEDDPYGTRRQVEAVEQGCTCPVEVVMLAGCGHSPHREQAGRATDAIVAFIGRLRSAVEGRQTPSPAAGWHGLPEIDRTTHAIESNER